MRAPSRRSIPAEGVRYRSRVRRAGSSANAIAGSVSAAGGTVHQVHSERPLDERSHHGVGRAGTPDCGRVCACWIALAFYVVVLELLVQRRAIDLEDRRGLRFVAAGGGERGEDALLLELAQRPGGPGRGGRRRSG